MEANKKGEEQKQVATHISLVISESLYILKNFGFSLYAFRPMAPLVVLMESATQHQQYTTGDNKKWWQFSSGHSSSRQKLNWKKAQ